MEAATEYPAHAVLQLRLQPAPDRDLEPVRAQLREPGRETEVRQVLRPTLRRPVAAVGGLAGRHEVGQERAVVEPAAAGEVAPVEGAVEMPAAGIVDLELHLLASRRRDARVDRAPEQHMPDEAVGAGG